MKVHKPTAALLALAALLSLTGCGTKDEPVTAQSASAQSPSDNPSVDPAETSVTPDVPFDGDALVKFADIEYLGSTPANAGTGLKLRATLSEIIVRGKVAPPKIGTLEFIQLVGIDPAQMDEKTMLQEQRMFDVGKYKNAYMVLSSTDPEDRQLHELSAWTMQSSFEIRDGDLHFLGAGYNMDASFKAVRTAAAKVVSPSTSDLDFAAQFCKEVFGLTAERPITDAVDAARAAAVPSTTSSWSDLPGVAGPGERLVTVRVIQDPKLAAPGADQYVSIGAPTDQKPLQVAAQGTTLPAHIVVPVDATELVARLVHEGKEVSTLRVPVTSDPNAAIELTLPASWSESAMTSRSISVDEANRPTGSTGQSK